MMQTAFAAALLNPDAPVPAGITDPAGRPAPKRFSVYRNNVTTGLGRALEAAFPAIQKLVGDDFFRAMAIQFLRAHPPTSRQMMLYGDGFAAFIEGFEPAQSLGYLPDIARLEQAIRESYHAADAEALPAQTLALLPEARLLAARLRLAPSARLLRSPWPIHAIWSAAMQNGPPPVMQAQDVLVLRPAFDPIPYLLPVGSGGFVAGLLAGEPFALALEKANASFDLTAVLTCLIEGQAIVGIEE
jgi:hypothetical protein